MKDIGKGMVILSGLFLIFAYPIIFYGRAWDGKNDSIIFIILLIGFHIYGLYLVFQKNMLLVSVLSLATITFLAIDSLEMIEMIQNSRGLIDILEIFHPKSGGFLVDTIVLGYIGVVLMLIGKVKEDKSKRLLDQ